MLPRKYTEPLSGVRGTPRGIRLWWDGSVTAEPTTNVNARGVPIASRCAYLSEDPRNGRYRSEASAVNISLTSLTGCLQPLISVYSQF